MYVKTKDWIYDTDNLHYRFIENNKVYEVGWDVEKPTFVADIIAQSENLEELCDEFVYVRNKPSLEKPLTSLIRDLSIIDKVRKKSNTTVYGCIWTDKGLIYVAKMDSDGKLVLI